MKSTPAALVACALLSACHVTPLTSLPYSYYEANPHAEQQPSILPGGVAVLHDYPVCAFEELGEVKTTHHRVEITPSRIEALRAQAAVYGADAIIVHPNLPVCPDGGHPPICGGRGEYVIATAINYIDEPPTEPKPVLEYEFESGYDTIEFYSPDERGQPQPLNNQPSERGEPL